MINHEKIDADRFTPFVELSRRRRRDIYIKLRWKIKRDTSLYGGKFTSDTVIDEPDRPGLYKQWHDFYFLGNDGLTIWNANIVTAAETFWDQVGFLASDRANSLLTDEQKAQEFSVTHELAGYFGGQKCYRRAERPEQTYDCFGGLTFADFVEKSEREIIENEPPVIYESFVTNRGYRYGIGLEIVVLADEIDLNIVETAIERFRQMGESDWQSQLPVAREALPLETPLFPR